MIRSNQSTTICLIRSSVEDVEPNLLFCAILTAFRFPPYLNHSSLMTQSELTVCRLRWFQLAGHSIPRRAWQKDGAERICWRFLSGRAFAPGSSLSRPEHGPPGPALPKTRAQGI